MALGIDRPFGAGKEGLKMKIFGDGARNEMWDLISAQSRFNIDNADNFH
jgi:hypothetical protein